MIIERLEKRDQNNFVTSRTTHLAVRRGRLVEIRGPRLWARLLWQRASRPFRPKVVVEHVDTGSGIVVFRHVRRRWWQFLR